MGFLFQLGACLFCLVFKESDFWLCGFSQLSLISLAFEFIFPLLHALHLLYHLSLAPYVLDHRLEILFFIITFSILPN